MNRLIESTSDNKNLRIFFYFEKEISNEVLNYIQKKHNAGHIHSIYCSGNRNSKSMNMLKRLGGKYIDYFNHPEKINENFDAFCIGEPKTLEKLNFVLYQSLLILKNSGTLYIENFSNENSAFQAFYKNNREKLLLARQMMVNGVKEKNLHCKVYQDCAPSEFASGDGKLNIVCVLKSGPIYNVDYVNRLYAGVKRNFNKEFNFFCLTDLNSKKFDPNIEIIPLIHNFPGWWSKMEIFRPNIFPSGNVVFFDLDTLIADNIDFFDVNFENDTLYGLRDFYKINSFASGVLCFRTGEEISRLYLHFSSKADSIIRNEHGDQDFLGKQLIKKNFLQDVFLGKIKSFKVDCYEQSTGAFFVPKDTSVICFHGKPRMCDVNNPDFKALWYG